MLLKTTRNCSDLLLQLLHKGGSTPPWSQSELLLLGGVDPPQACDLLLLGEGLPPRGLLGPAAAAFYVETLMKRFYKGASRTCVR